MLTSFFLLLLFASTDAVAKSAQIVPGAYVIELEDIADSLSFLSHVDASKTMDLDFPLFKGASIQFDDSKTTDEQIAQLLSVPAIKNVWPKKRFPRPDDEVHSVASSHSGTSATRSPVKRVNQNDTFSPHVMTQVDKLRAKGIIGTGVKVAIIDSGIDYNHPALGGCYGAGCLVVGGYDFVGDKYNGSNTAIADNDPHDNCGGHGTHVAGIIAAQENQYGFTGAAPGVKLAAYRVFGCKGPTETDILIAAFMRAYADGANIITVSIGGTTGWSEEAGSVILSRLVDKGVIVTVAAGNEGETGIFYASGPAGGKNVAAIASYDNTVTPMLLHTSRYSIGNGTETAFDYTLGKPRNWKGVKLPLWTPSFNTSETDQGCKQYPRDTPDLSRKIALIRRGKCTFEAKAKNAAARGAKYIMLYNNVPGSILADVEVKNISAIGMVPAATGIKWVTALASGQNVTLDMLDPDMSAIKIEELVNNKTGGSLSTYTTWGPSYEADIKPQFGTPGGNILSTYPVALGSYAVSSGTSMATPLAAAIYALISNVRKTFDPLILQNVLAATAKPSRLNENDTISPLLAPIAQQGAGLLQAYDAAYATTVLSHSSLSFNDSARLVDKTFTITNTGDRAITYELDVIGAATAYTFSNSTAPDPFPGISLDNTYATVKLSEYKVTVPANGNTTIMVKVTPPSLDPVRLPVYGGYITLNATNGERLSLPYQGIVGDLNAHTVLNNTFVSRTSSDEFAPINDSNSTFLLPRTNSTKNITADLPVAVIRMTFGSPRINVEIVSASNHTRKLGHIVDSPINHTARGLQSITWNGQLSDRKYAPAGRYKFHVSALRIYGDPNDEKQYDTAESSAFTINYK